MVLEHPSEAAVLASMVLCEILAVGLFDWRRHYNAVRPHSSLGYRPPAPEAILPPARGLPYAALRSADGLADRGRILT
jgi:Integrase core domain